MSRRPLNAVWFGLAALGLAAMTTGLARADDRDRLQGTWKVIYAALGTPNGVKVANAGQLKAMSVIIDGDKLTLIEGAGTEVVTFTVNPNLRHINFFEPGAARKEVYRGIYEFDGATVKLCWGPTSAVRPVNYNVNKKNQHRYYILQK